MVNHCVNFGILKGVQKNEVIAGIQVPISSYTWAAGKEIFRNIVGCAYCFVLAVSNIHPQIQENIPQSAFLHLIKLYYKNVLCVCTYMCVCGMIKSVSTTTVMTT